MKKIVRKTGITLYFLLFVVCFVSISDTSVDKSLDIILIIDNSASMKNLSVNEIYLFLEKVAHGNRLGIVSFGTNAKLLHSLKLVQASEYPNNIKNDLFKSLKFDDQYTNINSGLMLAFSEFLNHEDEDSSKIALLITDGKIDTESGGSAKGVLNKYFWEKIIPNYILNNIIIYSIAYGDKPDMQFMQDIAQKTKGKCFISPDNGTLKDILSMIAGNINPVRVPQKYEEKAKEKAKGSIIELPSGIVLIFSIITTILFCFIVMIFILLIIYNRKVKNITKPASEPKPDVHVESIQSLGDLREDLSKIMKSIEETGSSLNGFQKKLIDYSFQSWQSEKEARDGYYRIISDLFLLLDYFEDFIQKGILSDKSKWLYERAHRILDDEGIEEIPVKRGDRFDGIYHKHIESRLDELSKGSILEVVRKGYSKSSNQKENEIVLRLAEVIVSSGRSIESENK